MKIFKKILIAVTLATALVPCSVLASVTGPQWGYENSTWYIFNYNMRSTLFNRWYYTESYNVYFPNADATATIVSTAEEAMLNNDKTQYLVYIENNDVAFASWQFDGKFESNKDYKSYTQTPTASFQRKYVSLQMMWYGWHTGAKEIDVSIPLPYHMDSLDTWSTLSSHQFTPILVGTSASDSWSFDLKTYFRSYYIDGALTCELQTLEGGAYTDGEFSITTNLTMPAKTVYANGNLCFNGGNSVNMYYSGSTKKTPSTNIAVKFAPKSSGAKSAYLVIKKGGNVIKKILLNAVAKDEFYLKVANNITLNTASYNVDLNDYVDAFWYDATTMTDESVTPKAISYSLVNTNPDVSLTADGLISARKMGYVHVLVSADYDREYSDGTIVPKSATANIAVMVTRGTLKFDGSVNTNWNNAANWFPHNQGENAIVPDFVNHNVEIAAECVISSGVGASCFNCTVPKSGTSGTLSINAGGKMYVAGELTSTASALTIKNGGNESSNGILVCETPSSSANATVELFVPSFTSSKPIWRYMGVPVVSGDVKNVDFVYQWDNMALYDNGFGDECWEKIGASVSAWNGYAMSKNSSSQSSVSGALIFGNHSHELNIAVNDSKAKKYPDADNNLITNSYTAPIKLSNVTVYDFITCNGATLYFFNGGTYEQWWNKAKDGGFNIGDEAGQFKTVTINTAEALGITEIPAGESFFVKAKYVEEQGTSQGSVQQVKSYFNFRYDMVKSNVSDIIASVNGSSASAPKEPEHFNILEVIVNGDSLADRVYLFESDNCSAEFDNGYDGIKILGIEGTPQIYATNDFGRTSINVDNTVTGQYIGFMAGKNGVHYTISFNTDRFEGYESLYLYDTMTGKYVNILEGETYTFTGKRSGEEKRFLIVGKHDVEADEQDDNTIFDRTGDDKKIDIFGNQALVSGFDDVEETVIISDMSGRIWWQSSTALGPWFDIPDLPSGIYIMSVGKCETKFIR